MFNHVGAQIKAFAKAILIVMVILAFGVGIYLWTKQLFTIGLYTIIGGLFAAWLSSVLLYAFGELVDNSAIIKDEMLKKASEIHSEDGE